jgi:hypothetical protein
MIPGLHTLGQRFGVIAPKPPAPSIVDKVVALIPYFQNWKRTMERIDQKISDARDRRLDPVAQRDAFDAAFVAGDDAAKPKADKIDKIDKLILDTDRELERLHIQRTHAAQRVAVEGQAEAEREHREHLAAVKHGHGEWIALAKAIDEATGTLATALAAFRDKGDALRQLVAHTEMNFSVFNLAGSTALVVNNRLARTGFDFKHSPILAGADLTVAQFMPDEQRIMTLANERAPKG